MGGEECEDPNKDGYILSPFSREEQMSTGEEQPWQSFHFKDPKKASSQVDHFSVSLCSPMMEEEGGRRGVQKDGTWQLIPNPEMLA